MSDRVRPVVEGIEDEDALRETIEFAWSFVKTLPPKGNDLTVSFGPGG